MKTEIMIAVLALLCIGSLAAAFVLWAKLDEQKQKTADEHANYIAALNLHNAAAKALEQSKSREECSAQSVLWYAEQLTNAKQEAEGLKMGVDYLGHREDVLQDKLSAILCPRNDHVWKDGVCVKCGRVQDV